MSSRRVSARRSGRGTVDPSKRQAITRAFLALFQAGDFWFDADRVTVDGVSGKLLSYVDYNDPTHILTQADTTKQCALPAANASFGGAKVTTFVAGTPSAYVSNRAASAFAYQSNGSATVCHVFDLGDETAVRYLSRTTTSGTNGVIFYAIRATAPTRHSFRLFGGGALDAIVTADAGPQSLTYTLSPTAYVLYKKATSSSSGGATPPAGSPDLTFALSELTQPFDGLHRAVYSWQRVLSATELRVKDAFIRMQTGGAV